MALPFVDSPVTGAAEGASPGIDKFTVAGLLVKVPLLSVNWKVSEPK